MIKVHSKALEKTIEVDRIIDHIKGKKEGPTLIFVGGIHGNEPAGIFGLKKVLSELNSTKINGNIYALSGNLSALKKGIRYNKTDLNRLWTKDGMKAISDKENQSFTKDQEEQYALYMIIKEILNTEKGPFYFFDIHTTSSETLPFLTVNDSLLNRYFTFQYPLPIILGIEEYLDGPILSYINELGYVAFGFEAGQHDDMASIENSVAFIYLTLSFTGCIDKNEIAFQRYYDMLAKTAGDEKNIYEIVSRHIIKENEDFKMEPGFFNFQRIRENQHLANSDGKILRAPNNGRIFMPLYQPMGSDGFFTIKKIWKPFLRLSEFLRKYKLERLLVFLPGIKWIDEKKSGLIVNKKIARFLVKDIFHLFGYRNSHVTQNHFNMFNRETNARQDEYKRAEWIN